MFKPGDKIVYLKDIDNRALKGLTGTIISKLNNNSYLTQPDDGLDYKWYAYKQHIKPLERKLEFNDPEYEALLI